MSDPVDKIEEWLGRHYERRDGERAARVCLVHLDDQDRPAQLGDLHETDAPRIARMAYTEAYSYAESYPGPQRFGLRLYFGASQRPAAQHVWLINAEAEAGSESLARTERANAEGLLAKLMRHLEAKERTTLTLLENVYTTLRAELSEVRAENAELNKQRLHMIEVTEELVQQRHMRAIEEKRLQSGEARKDAALQSVQQIIPILGAHMSQKLGLPAPVVAGADLASFGQLLKGLNAQQIEAFAASLAPAQQIAFLDLYRRYALAGETNFKAAPDA